MKIQAIIVSLLLVAIVESYGQSSGQINYEVVRKVDPAGIRIMINGEQVKPGDPNFPADIPDTRTFGQKVLFTPNFVRENRDEQNAVVRRTVADGNSAAPQNTNMGRPFEEQVFVDVVGQKVISLLTVGKDKDAKTYKSESPIQRISGWQPTDQTKKIAGYTCKKSTVEFKKETYSVWVTTELPLTYSPIPDLTPEKGVALLIEGSREQFKATKVTLENIDPKSVQPDAQAETVPKEKLADIREKALADFRQKMMMGEGN
ncbi:hypothetical protein [Dyadobacter sp. CY323]|uniref:hypothetical protein n=1 Tax=Dyadobacter sp. CY323 TaxID=2907302 RepID=UPI001F3279EC|nr:hypothetical protein [Dyadobacter sp. CY323]MCE6991002.1 hypothetical protein [Dyadobacter sp. CY323]